MDATVNSLDKKAGKERLKLVDKKELENLINRLEGLNDTQKLFLQQRWLHQVLWWDRRSRTSRWKYYLLRSIAVVGSVIMPALIGLNGNEAIYLYTKWVTFGIGLAVAISIALNELFHFGDIWKEKRDATEVLKIEGWRFFQQSGKYSGKEHAAAFPEFAEQVENIIEGEIKSYIGFFKDDNFDKQEKTLTTADSGLLKAEL